VQRVLEDTLVELARALQPSSYTICKDDLPCAEALRWGESK